MVIDLLDNHKTRTSAVIGPKEDIVSIEIYTRFGCEEAIVVYADGRQTQFGASDTGSAEPGMSTYLMVYNISIGVNLLEDPHFLKRKTPGKLLTDEELEYEERNG